MERKIKQSGSFVSLGGEGGAPARAITYGLTSAKPSDGTGNDKDIYVATDSPYKVWQKLSGTWADVTWTDTQYFSKSAAVDEPATWSIDLQTAPGQSTSDAIYIQTVTGEVSIGFYNSNNAESAPSNNITIDCAYYPDGGSQTTAICNEISMSYSSIVAAENVGALRFSSLDAGGGAYLSYRYNGLNGSGSAEYTTTYGGTSSGTETYGPLTFKAAEAGKRHIIQYAYADAITEGFATPTVTLKIGSTDVGYVPGIVGTAGYMNLHTRTALSIQGVLNASIAGETSGFSDEQTLPVTVGGFTLVD